MLHLAIFILMVGRLFIYLVQSLPPIREMKNSYFHKLFNCDLCLGVWVYFALSCFFKFEITSALVGTYMPIISEMVTAGIFSFTMHLIRLGWKLKFGVFDE